jgi:hypothetical protein
MEHLLASIQSSSLAKLCLRAQLGAARAGHA